MEDKFRNCGIVGTGGVALGELEAEVASELGVLADTVKSIVRRHRNERNILMEKEDYHVALTEEHDKVPFALSSHLLSLTPLSESRFFFS
jgi:hypothetical protein